jgi:CRP-like cAMP-binding protein
MPALPIMNRLLRSLSPEDRARVTASCERIEMNAGDILDSPDSPSRYVYFPVSGCVSLLKMMKGQHAIEVALVGEEGFIGTSAALGVDLAPVLAQVSGEGEAWRMSATAFHRELLATPALKGCIDRYLGVLMSHVIQAAGCTRYHVIEERLARRLLVAADRARGPSFAITHEALARILGVRRVGVTTAAGSLQNRDLILYKRGHLTVRDRKGLEAAACTCYRADLAAYMQVFGLPAKVAVTI